MVFMFTNMLELSVMLPNCSIENTSIDPLGESFTSTAVTPKDQSENEVCKCKRILDPYGDYH